MTDVTLAFEDDNSKLLDIVCVVDVDAEECVDDSLVEILELRLGDCKTFTTQTFTTPDVHHLRRSPPLV